MSKWVNPNHYIRLQESHFIGFMVRNLVLFGGGPHAHICIDILEKVGGFHIIGIIDSIAEIGSTRHGFPVIGRQEDITSLKKRYHIEAGIIAIGDNYSRKYVRDMVIERETDFEFINLIHPSVIIGRGVKLGVGIVMSAGVIVNPDCIIADFCTLCNGAILDQDSFMGEFSLLSSGSVTGAKVKIGRFAAITLGVTLIDRISIGENTVVGSGAVVLNDLPDHVWLWQSCKNHPQERTRRKISPIRIIARILKNSHKPESDVKSPYTEVDQ
ncbi:MAG: acetyltransferase [Saprospiraceae bacterium]|nr:acetyltransferase [Saprospiraceae bacterium]